jgi:hypothetical protein
MESTFPSSTDVVELPVVGEFTDWARLGVHLPISLLGTGDEIRFSGGTREVTDITARVTAGELPAYVRRDADLEPDTGLRAVLSAAAAQSDPPVRLVVVGGESAAGKTRSAVEAMRAELPEWRLLIPCDVATLRRYSALPRTVVWLDEVQRLLGEPGGIAEMERLLALAEGPTVLLGTLSDDQRDSLRGGAWVLLDQRARWVRLTRELTNSELARANELDDPWIAEAVRRTEDRFGIAEWLAAGPLLQRRLELARLSTDAVQQAGAALVDGAIQCVRAGYDTPLPLPLLAEAHGLYYRLPLRFKGLDDDQIPQLDEVMRWAREPVVGSMGLLRQRLLRGDEVAHCLVGHSQVAADPIDPRLWPILLRHITPRTLLEIGLVATCQHDNRAVTGELARRAELMGDLYIAAELYAVLGNEAELARCADAGDTRACELLAGRLAERDDRAELARRAEAGDSWAATTLARLLGERESEDEFVRRTRARMDATEGWRARLRSDPEAEAELVRQADAGDAKAALELAVLLLDRGDEEALARRADARDGAASAALSQILLKRGDEEALVHRANAGDYWAAGRLADLLVERGDQAQLAVRAALQDTAAADRLLDVYEERGDETELERLALFGVTQAGQMLANLRAVRDCLPPDSAGVQPRPRRR